MTKAILPTPGQAVLAWSISICKPVLLPAAIVAVWLCYRRVSLTKVVGVLVSSCLLSAVLFLMTSTHLWTVILRGYESQWIVPFGNLTVPPPFVGAALTLLAMEVLAPALSPNRREASPC